MQLDTYVEQVQDQLTATAALGDERVREVAATLAGAASPAIRLAILSALATAADEITTALLDRPGSPTVVVRLDADEIAIAVTGPTESTSVPRPDDGDTSARISLRLSEALKAEIDTAANRAGISVNTWLVRAATSALGSGPVVTGTQRLTGWINS
jgi:hypothetical protein